MKRLLSKNLSLSMALRYLNPLRTHFSIITLICLFGVALGVMVLIVVLSVMGGLQQEMRSRMAASAPHVKIELRDLGNSLYSFETWRELSEEVTKVEGVESAYALVDNFALVAGKETQNQTPVFFRAIDTENEHQIKELNNLVTEGTADMGLDERAVISSRLAKNLGVTVGGIIRIFSTSNIDEISQTYAQMDLQRLIDRFPDDIAVLETFPQTIKEKSGKLIVPRVDYDKMMESLSKLEIEEKLPAEQEMVFGLVDALQHADVPEEMEADIVLTKPLTEEWGKQIAALKAVDKDQEDLKNLKAIKNLVLPRDLEVVGIYPSSMHIQLPEVFMPLGIGQEILGYEGDKVLALGVRLKDPDDCQKVMDKMAQALTPPEYGHWIMTSWKDQFKEFTDLMQRERMMMNFVLSFISLISAFCIMAVMFTVAVQRRKELSVMKALGATPSQIVGVFLWQGVLIGIVGGLLGVGLGMLVIEFRLQIYEGMVHLGFDPFPADLHGTEGLPAVVDYGDMAFQAVKAFFMVVCVSVIPACIAAYQDPAKALRSL